MRFLSPHTSIKSRAPVKASFFKACFSLFSIKSRSRFITGILCFTILLAIGVVTPAGQVLAATKTSTLAPGDQASSFAYYKALRTCMSTGWYKNSNIPPFFAKDNTMSQQDGVNYDWFNPRQGSVVSNGINVGAFNDPRGSSGDGAQNCGDNEGRAWIAKAMTLWGYTSGPQFLCDLGFSRENSSVACSSTAEGITNNFIAPGDATQRLDKFWQNTLGNSSTSIGSITSLGGAYSLYLKSFLSQCRVVEGGNAYSIQVFKEGSETPVTVSYGAPDRDRKSDYSVTIYDQKQMTCGDLAKAISDPKSAVVVGYQAYLKANDGVDPTSPTSPECTASACPDTSTETSCAIEDVGWLVCPAIGFMATIADSAFSFLSNSFLSVNVSELGTSGATYQIWSIMRNIANIAFVLAFLVIVFSQLTGQGIANYGIKKLLPRLVIAAILVNISFFICQIAVDVSNIIGFSINQVFESIGKGVTLPNGVVPPSNESGNWAGIALTVTAAVGVGWALGASVLIPLLLGAVIALVMVFLILVLRQVLIILLIIVAPIAFVAFLLPNTEQWFTKWRKMFVALLLVFPIIGLLFGASSLASTILSAVTYSQDNDISGMIGKIVAAGVIALPLFLIYPVLKGAISSAGSIGAKINGMGDRFGKGAQSKAANSGVIKALAHQKQTKRAQIGAGIYEGKNPLSKVRSRVNSRLNKSNAYNAVTGNYGTIRGANIDKLENEETKLAEAAIQLRAREGKPGTSLEDQFNSAIQAKDLVRAKAAQNILMRSGSSGVNSVRKVIQGNEASLNEAMRSGLASNIAENHGQVAKQKAPDLLKWSTNPYLSTDEKRENKLSMQQISASSEAWSGLSARELADLPDASFRSAMSSGGVSIATRTALLSERMRENLSDGQRAALGTETTPGEYKAPATASLAATQPQATQVPTQPLDAYDARLNQRRPEQTQQDPVTMPQELRVQHEEQAQSNNPNASNRGSSTDENGRSTPNQATDDYHEGMSK